MNTQETLYRLALPLLPGIGINSAHNLLQAAGSATVLFTHPKELPDILPQASPRLMQAFDHPEILRRCEAELAFAEKNQIACLTTGDEDYPSRLRECDDAPLVLFYRGNHFGYKNCCPMPSLSADWHTALTFTPIGQPCNTNWIR